MPTTQCLPQLFSSARKQDSSMEKMVGSNLEGIDRRAAIAKEKLARDQRKLRAIMHRIKVLHANVYDLLHQNQHLHRPVHPHAHDIHVHFTHARYRKYPRSHGRAHTTQRARDEERGLHTHNSPDLPVSNSSHKPLDDQHSQF